MKGCLAASETSSTAATHGGGSRITVPRSIRAWREQGGTSDVPSFTYLTNSRGNVLRVNGRRQAHRFHPQSFRQLPLERALESKERYKMATITQEGRERRLSSGQQTQTIASCWRLCSSLRALEAGEGRDRRSRARCRWHRAVGPWGSSPLNSSMLLPGYPSTCR